MMFDDTFVTPELQLSYDRIMHLVTTHMGTDMMVAVEWEESGRVHQMAGQVTDCMLGWFRANAESFTVPPRIIATWYGSKCPEWVAPLYHDYLERIRR